MRREVSVRLYDEERAQAFVALLGRVDETLRLDRDDEILVESLRAQAQAALNWNASQRARIPAEPLTDQDLEVCPVCDTGDAWLQEIGTRATWQPFELQLHDGELLPGTYYSSTDGDDTEVEFYECRNCDTRWDSLDDVHRSLIAAKHARADAALLPAAPVEEEPSTESALAVLITTPLTRAFLEVHDPKAVEQARRALDLDDKEATDGAG